jgi:hypothetical protein
MSVVIERYVESTFDVISQEQHRQILVRKTQRIYKYYTSHIFMKILLALSRQGTSIMEPKAASTIPSALKYPSSHRYSVVNRTSADWNRLPEGAIGTPSLKSTCLERGLGKYITEVK